MTRFRSAWRISFVLLLIAVTWVTLTPDPDEVSAGFELTRIMSELLFGSDLFGDKIAHFGAYAALGFLAVLARLMMWRSFIPIGMMLAGYGVLLEFGQGWGGVRTMEFADALANAGGAFVGCIAAMVLLLAEHYRAARQPERAETTNR